MTDKNITVENLIKEQGLEKRFKKRRNMHEDVQSYT
jgi:hypothetical protein